MSEEMLIDSCAPTMAGLKTGNLFTCPCEDPDELKEAIRRINQKLVPKQVCLLPLRISDKKALLYMFRPKRLREDLRHAKAQELLGERNYPCGHCIRCLARLAERLQSGDEFPHEVGLFLSYPPEDVDGFIRHGAQCSKCTGTWQVYGDECAARRRFAQYQKCKHCYKQAYKRHGSFDRLVVRS